MPNKYFPLVVKLLALKDGYTYGHAARVALFASKILFLMKSKDEKYLEIDDESFFKGAIIHDIGKAGVPDIILNKKGELTHEDLQFMRMHASIGRELCIRAGITDAIILEIVESHQEQCNGSGYPYRIGESLIPLSAKIVTIADCFDACTTKRPYKPVKTWKDFVEELEEQILFSTKGAYTKVKYDIEICKIFVHWLKEEFGKRGQMAVVTELLEMQMGSIKVGDYVKAEYF